MKVLKVSLGKGHLGLGPNIGLILSPISDFINKFDILKLKVPSFCLIHILGWLC